ncbi:alpha/beta hydrolase [Leptospira fletcheri]|uniref:Alpha/beta hydrolase n=1 Tax=Leptospira fletcheri TaxID=2484981 RepID=A0A4R9GJB4_9LEPT|nr:alpha/beta hydrolase [Leptospira fletcheri]TGK12193.1 alpha/beta hydrolase [Leptospira fletcheri]
MDFIYRFFLRNYVRNKIRYMESELGFRKVYSDVGGHKLFYLKREADSGSKKNLLLVHGLLDSSSGFRKLAPFLRTDYTILLPDIPGFGLSPMPPIRYLYQVDVFADLIYESIREMDLRDLVLGGHSMGSLIAMYIALLDAKREKRIKKLVLLAPGGIPHPKRDEMRELLFPKNFEEIERLFASLYHESSPSLGSFTKKILLSSWNDEPYRFLTRNTLDREAEIFLGKRISEIKLRSIIISGKEDPITYPSMVKKIHGYLKGSDLVWIPSAKHALHIEKAQEVASAINDWI